MKAALRIGKEGELYVKLLGKKAIRFGGWGRQSVLHAHFGLLFCRESGKTKGRRHFGGISRQSVLYTYTALCFAALAAKQKAVDILGRHQPPKFTTGNH